MTIKYAALLLLAFVFTPNTHTCAGPSGADGAVEVGGAMVACAGIPSAAINTLFLIGKELGLKRSLSAKHIALTSLVCNGLVTAAYLACNIRYYENRPQGERYDIDYHNVCNYLPIPIIGGIALTTAYNYYQCTKEEPAKIALPAHINTQVLEQLHDKKQLINRDANDN